jgi:hypothetical protein
MRTLGRPRARGVHTSELLGTEIRAIIAHSVILPAA